MINALELTRSCFYLDDSPDIVESARFARVGLSHNHRDEVGDDGEDVDDIHHSFDEFAFFRCT